MLFLLAAEQYRTVHLSVEIFVLLTLTVLVTTIDALQHFETGL